MPKSPHCWLGNSDEDLLNACKVPRRAGGADDFSMMVLTRQD